MAPSCMQTISVLILFQTGYSDEHLFMCKARKQCCCLGWNYEDGNIDLFDSREVDYTLDGKLQKLYGCVEDDNSRKTDRRPLIGRTPNDCSLKSLDALLKSEIDDISSLDASLKSKIVESESKWDDFKMIFDMNLLHKMLTLKTKQDDEFKEIRDWIKKTEAHHKGLTPTERKNLIAQYRDAKEPKAISTYQYINYVTSIRDGCETAILQIEKCYQSKAYDKCVSEIVESKEEELNKFFKKLPPLKKATVDQEFFEVSFGNDLRKVFRKWFQEKAVIPAGHNHIDIPYHEKLKYFKTQRTAARAVRALARAVVRIAG
jgi:hypothetical protein